MTLTEAIAKVRFHARWIRNDRRLSEALTMVADAAADHAVAVAAVEDDLHAHVRACPQCHRARHVAPDVPTVAIGRDRMCDEGKQLSVAFVNALVAGG